MAMAIDRRYRALPTGFGIKGKRIGEIPEIRGHPSSLSWNQGVGWIPGGSLKRKWTAVSNLAS
jgi:hypothetical protein